VNVAKRALVDGGVAVGGGRRGGDGDAGQKGAQGEAVNGEDRNAGMQNPSNRQDIRYVFLSPFSSSR
jgi:hypothetical protein